MIGDRNPAWLLAVCVVGLGCWFFAVVGAIYLVGDLAELVR